MAGDETQANFFLQQVPQSMYRRSRSTPTGDSTRLSTQLNPLGINDPLLIQMVREHIERQAQQVFDIFLPGKEWNAHQKMVLMSKIFQSLGLE